MREFSLGMLADIALHLFPPVLDLDLLTAGTDMQKAFQNLDPPCQPGEQKDFHGDRSTEDRQLNADFTASLAPGRGLVSQHEVRQVQNFVSKSQGQKNEQDHCLPNENISYWSIVHDYKIPATLAPRWYTSCPPK